ncbi:protein-glutamate methylesterase/protein-glutamine glutaminase [Thiorhodospira sibirica]|uniref:protein-glutamate methylesterase/protein-glutamine glutaminase n=1 Tax=Thiorhodospira sibirica TaxID=154347 RepID=UPI00022C4C41|nr:chemotaxis response regulator protein-glutamate methylesterase [Thiorhodospira sibirica]
MAVRVLVVDDSGFFRRRIVELLNLDPGIEVIGTAADGKEAVEQAIKLKPDVITMDIEMPVMDGITAVKRIMAVQPTHILMFSSLTFDGAKATLDALDAGAVDFLPKRFEDISRDQDEAKSMLLRRVKAIGLGRKRPLSKPAPGTRAPAASPVAPAPVPSAGKTPSAPLSPVSPASTERGPLKLRDFKAVLIGTSTGGPVALQNVLTQLPENFPLPLLLIQHMPATFTPAFAERLNQLCAIRVKEAEDGDIMQPGLALLAPGGKQMIVDKKGTLLRVRVQESPPEQNYRPCVDITFKSAEVLKGEVLAIIMTGMGSDGREGARLLKSHGAKIWAQDEDSCVVYGMPAAVVDAGLADRILPLAHIGKTLAGGV